MRCGISYRDVDLSNHLQYIRRGSSEADISKFCCDVSINPRSVSLTDTELKVAFETAVDEVM